MPLMVAALEEILDNVTDTFRLAPATLELAGFTAACVQYLADQDIVVREVTQVDRDGLRVVGAIAVRGQDPSPGSVTFTADDAWVKVVGARVDVRVNAASTLLPATHRRAVESLAVLKPVNPRLVFGEEPGPGGRIATRIGVGTELEFPDAADTHKPYVWGYPPTLPTGAWQLAGEFTGVSLDGLTRLADLTGRLPGDGFTLPTDVPQDAAKLTLTGLGITFGVPTTGGATLISVWTRVDLGTRWSLAGGQLVVTGLHAEFGVTLPRNKPRLVMVLGGQIEIAKSVPVELEIRLPDRAMSASLATPMQLRPLLSEYFSGLSMPDLAVSELTLWGTAEGNEVAYGCDFAINGTWKVSEDITLTEVALTVGKKGSTVTASADAYWHIGATADDGVLAVHGEWATASGWRLAANATNVRLAALFSGFGITPPPLVKDVVLHQLGVTYDSQTQAVLVSVAGAFPLGDVAASLGLDIALSKRSTGRGYDQTYTGSLTLEVPDQRGATRTLRFTLTNAQYAEFAATCDDPTGVSLADLARLLGVTDPAAGELLSRLGTVTKITIGYSSARKSVVFAVQERDGGSLVVASVKPANQERAWVVRVALGLSAGLSQVPLLRGQIPPEQDVRVAGLGMLVAPRALTAAQLGQLNQALAACDATMSLLPAGGVAKGVAFAVDLRLPGQEIATSVMVRAPDDQSTTGTVLGGVMNTTEDGPATSGLPMVAWVDVQRAVGPLRLRRVGVSFADGTVWVLFEASLGMAGLTLGVAGLGIGVPLAAPTSPRFRLDGLSAGYSRPPLEIKGALVNRPENDTYAVLVQGTLTVSAQKFGVTALGAYARPRTGADQPSMFVFGKVTGKFGGPPPIELTGIMAGFGYHTSIRLPDGDKVLDFPFLKNMDSTSPDADPLVVLAGLMGGGKDAWVRPTADNLWFAAGLTFDIFEFLHCQALLILEVGDDFVIALLGTAQARFPRDTSTRAYAQARLGLSAVYRASERILKVTAQLAPGSYLVDEACALTGGFAFYVWFDDAHAGDFVLTIGGYHPKFPVPAHYPTVPRLGINWPVSANLTISGGAYFALTPGAIMAGGELAVDYRSGDLHAWLVAHTDLLVEWAPFRFDAEIGISIGVSYVLNLWLVRETIRVEVGAQLHLWGPPTAGTVTVHLWFIKFTVAFGDGTAIADRSAQWAEVVKQLPPADNAVRLTATAGLASVRAKDERDREMWVVGPGEFSFALRTAVPITTLRLGDDNDALAVNGRPVNLRPRHDQGKDLVSVCTLTLVRKDNGDKQRLADWYPGTQAEARGDLPAALWGPYDGKLTVQSTQWVTGQLTGIDLRRPLPKQGSSPGMIAAGTLAFDDRHPDGALPFTQDRSAAEDIVAGGDARTDGAAEISTTVEQVSVGSGGDGMTPSEVLPKLADASVRWARDRLFEAMGYLGVSPGTNDRLTADDPLVAGDITAKQTRSVHGRPTPLGARLYVLSGSGGSGSLTPVDVSSLTPFTPSRLSQVTPTGICVSRDGRWAVLLQDLPYGGELLPVYDIATNPPTEAKYVNANQVTPKALAAAVLSDGKRIGLIFEKSTQFIVVNLETLGMAWGSLSGEVPGGVTASPTRQLAYVSIPTEDVVRVIDVSGYPQTTDSYAAGPCPTRLAMDPKERWLYAINDGHSTVSLIDPRTPSKPAFTLATGTDPNALVASPDGRRLYVANPVAGTVSVFDVSGATPRELGEPVWVGPEPLALAVSPDSARLFVARSGVRAVQVVDTTTDRPTLLPHPIPVTAPPVALAVTVPPADTSTA